VWFDRKRYMSKRIQIPDMSQRSAEENDIANVVRPQNQKTWLFGEISSYMPTKHVHQNSDNQ
jgi:hypothetical protein